mmetsp:Transcript_78461/g.221843  ORF Transcript_78461/g.221843 Transcript_78461/m.221843 type:complete len:345 (-) Transcript_78461:542-1576(-)
MYYHMGLHRRGRIAVSRVAAVSHDSCMWVTRTLLLHIPKLALLRGVRHSSGGLHQALLRELRAQTVARISLRLEIRRRRDVALARLGREGVGLRCVVGWLRTVGLLALRVALLGSSVRLLAWRHISMLARLHIRLLGCRVTCGAAVDGWRRGQTAEHGLPVPLVHLLGQRLGLRKLLSREQLLSMRLGSRWRMRAKETYGPLAVLHHRHVPLQAQRSRHGWISGLQRRQWRRDARVQGALQGHSGPLPAFGLWWSAAGSLRHGHGTSALPCTIFSFLFALCNLLLGLRVVHNHIAGLRPFGLEVPDMAARVGKLNEALGCRLQGLLGVDLGHELHEAEAPWFSR